MKILIIEDEIRAVSQLQSLLKACLFSYEIIEIIDTIEDAVPWFVNNKMPDLVFMDIQLADGLSFEIFQKTKVSAPIIFTTAFDQYAIKAFKVNSIDYLLKPVQKNDLQQAINKFMNANSTTALDTTSLNKLLNDLQKPIKREGILVKSGNGFVHLRIADLLYCYSEDSITFGVTHNQRYIIEETIDKLFETLDHQKFFKINRGQVVAKTSILKIESYFNHRVILSVKHASDKEFIVSRLKTQDFKQWMNQ